MKTRSISRKRRAQITGSRDTRGTRTNKHRGLAEPGSSYPEPTVCDGCGAVFAHRTWRLDRPVTHALLASAAWAKCPTCRRRRDKSGFGRVIVKNCAATSKGSPVGRRIRNVESRALATQPGSRIVSMEPVEDCLEILTSSQQLAHRIVHELKKAFGGQARYRWSDRDGSLFATWHAPPAAC